MAANISIGSKSITLTAPMKSVKASVVIFMIFLLLKTWGAHAVAEERPTNRAKAHLPRLFMRAAYVTLAARALIECLVSDQGEEHPPYCFVQGGGFMLVGGELRQVPPCATHIGDYDHSSCVVFYVANTDKTKKLSRQQEIDNFFVIYLGVTG